MIEIKTNEFTRRFLLLIYFLGSTTDKNEKFIETKKRFLKLYYLSLNPRILDKVLDILIINENKSHKKFRKKLKDTFIMFFHGVYLKNFANKLSESIRLDLIRIEKKGQAHFYFLTERGLEIVKNIIKENNLNSQKYIFNLKKMIPLTKISTKKITQTLDNITEKKKKKIGDKV